MNVTLVLGEYARAAEGRLDVLGAGWVTTGSPASFGIGILFEAQPGEFGGKHTIVLELVDEDGQPVPVPDSDQPLVRVEGEIEVIPPQAICRRCRSWCPWPSTPRMRRSRRAGA